MFKRLPARSQSSFCVRGRINSLVGNLPSLPGIFPDYPAPILRHAPECGEIVIARWGMPTSRVALMECTKKRAAKLQAKGRPVDFKELLRLEPDCGVTNIRNTANKHWQHRIKGPLKTKGRTNASES